MENRINNNLIFENAGITYRNFAGKASDFNREGDRNFAVIIDDPETAKEIEAQGWNVKLRRAKEEDDREFYYLPVAIKFNGYRPPKIKMIIGGNAVSINEDNANLIDEADIDYVDLVVRPYNWEMNGNTGVKAYCAELYVNCIASKFEDKYKDINGII